MQILMADLVEKRGAFAGWGLLLPPLPPQSPAAAALDAAKMALSVVVAVLMMAVGPDLVPAPAPALN